MSKDRNLALAAPDERRALVELGFRELGAAAGGIQGVHRAIAARAFDATGSGARPVRLVHDAVSATAYGGVRAGAALAGRAASSLLSRQGAGKPAALSQSPRGAMAIGLLNGLIGDALERDGSPLAQPMAVHTGGRPLDCSRSALRSAFAGATPRVVVFLHGLMESERAWSLGAHAPGDNYGRRLERDLELTPVFIRYNSGRHVSENGRSLADLLEKLMAQWPVEVSEVALVGHSMGGLMSRSACRQASEHGHAWVERVRHVVSIGSPHMGAPIAQGLHWAVAALDRLPETRPFAGLLRRRSAGIRDLRQGSLVDEDWLDRDPDALRVEACREVPLLEGASHCFVAATVTRSARHPVGRLLGDCLVLEASASGRSRSRRIPFEAEYGLHLGGTHHLALLNHPAVYERLRDWLAPPG